MADPGTGEVSGRVTDEQQKGIEGASVTLLRVKDSTLYKILVTDRQGKFDLSGVPLGNYRLKVTAVGFGVGEDRQFIVGDSAVRLGEIRLVAVVASMQQVEVTGRRPLLEMRPDRTIVNVEAAVTNAGATALEVLQKSPGVTVDKDGNIALKGKQGVTVMMDGKPTYLSGADLSALLSSMSANQLDQIEIMTNPPAKYDAAGNAGVINIRTKKNQRRGFNGSVTLGYGQGRYWKTTNSMSLNYRNEKYNLFLNYSSNVLRGFTDLHIIRQYLAPDNKTVTAIFDEPTYIRRKISNNTLKLGMDYYLSKKTTFGVVTSGFISPRNAYGDGAGYLQDAGGTTDSMIRTISSSENRVRNGALNFNLRHAFDSAHELSADADYIVYSGRNPQLFFNTATHPNGTVDSGHIKGLVPSLIRIWSGKADYTQVLHGGMKLEAGWKSSIVTTDNTADYFNEGAGGSWIPDYGKTNHFIYRENINAAYVNLNKEMGKWTLQGGLRFENTYYKGHQLGNPLKPDSVFTRRYNNVFPTVYVSYQVNADNQFTLSTGRRIDRPAYQDLNPFLFFVNQYTYQQGNPFLNPQYTTNIELSHVFKGVFTTTVNYSHIQAYIQQIFNANGDTTIFNNGNLGRLDNVGLSMNAQLELTKWWTATLHMDLVYKKVDGYTKEVVRSEGVSAFFEGSNQFKFRKGWAAELSGFYNTRDKDAQFITESFWQLSTGVSKQVMKGKGTVKLNVSDIFFTEPLRAGITYQNVREHFLQSRDSRAGNLSFTYRFGKTLKGPAHRGNGGAGDELNRVKF